jgi:sucrose-6-phosphate hydrolase SacC (GH32 family)
MELAVSTGVSEHTLLLLELDQSELTLDRRRSGLVGFHARFPGVYRAPIRLIGGKLKFRLFVDSSSTEVFVNDGETVLSSLVFPSSDARQLGLRITRGALERIELEAWKLRSAWRQRQ